MVLDRAPHTLHGLLRSVVVLRLVSLDARDGPKGRLLPASGPMGGLPLAYGVPTGLVLPVIVATRYRKPGLCPNYLRTDPEVTGLDRILNQASERAGVPDIGHISRE